MGTRKNYGVNEQLEGIKNAIAARGSVGANAASLDAIYASMLDGSNTTKVFWQWWALARAQDIENEASADQNRYHTLSRWFDILAQAWGEKVYTLRFADYRVGGSNSVMTPLAGLADKTSAPLLTETGTDSFHWMDEDPMYWYVRFNGLSLEDGAMNILAVEGVDDNFDITGNLAPVYTASAALWKVQFTDGTWEYKTWALKQQSGMWPYEADVAPDGSHRSFYWAATFGGSLTADGKLTSGSGYKNSGWERNTNTPAWRRAAVTGIADARKWDAYEGTYTDTDRDKLLDMWQMRHWNLENSGILEGCTNYQPQYTVAMAEEGATSVLVTTAQAANFLVGSCVEVGTHPSGTNNDRNTAANYDLIPCATITRIETVTIDGTSYGRVHLDITAAIDIPETAFISSMPWVPGSTEHIPGKKDGSLYHLTNGKTPARIAGIEVIDGAYAVGLDPLWNSDYNAERNPKSIYAVYACRDSQNQGGSIGTNHVKVATFESENTGWQYIKHFEIRRDGMLIPDALGASSSTFLKSAFGFYAGSGVRAPWWFAALNYTGPAGVACAYGAAPSRADWVGRPRLGGSGKKRGEWAA